MGFSVETGVPVLTVFLQGLLSFFSPCVLPLVPLYISYLAGGAKIVDEAGVIRYPRKKVLVNTLFFVLGVSFAFFALGFGFSALGRFFSGNKVWFSRIAGVVMILFGLYQLGLFGKFGAVEKEHRLPLKLDRWAMNPLIALILGFTFSFAWTPCVGPALTSVLLMAGSATSWAAGFALIGVYTAGFVLPFLAVGLFTGAVLGFFKKHQKVVRYTVKAGGALLIIMGIMTIAGWMNGLTGYLSSFTGDSGKTASSQTAPAGSAPSGAKGPVSSGAGAASSAPVDPRHPPAPDFTLKDQYENTHTLSDYKGKTVFLNFWATWCGPCKAEMPDIQKLYEQYGGNRKDLIVLGVAEPRSDQHPKNVDAPQEEIKQFLKENGYTYPVVMDVTGEFFEQYYVRAYPTTYLIRADGTIEGVASGMLTYDLMTSYVKQTMTGQGG